MKMYETVVKGIGENAKLFEEENMLILFGNEAPDALKDYCYTIEVVPVTKKIQPGMTLYIDDNQYIITSVGDLVAKNLSDLGHITIKFNGLDQAELPGTLHVSNGTYPAIEVGSTLQID